MQRRDWLYVSDHAGAVEHVLRPRRRRARPTTSPGDGGAAEPRSRRPRCWPPRQALVAGPERARTGRVTIVATRWTASKLRAPRLAEPDVGFEAGLGRDDRLVRRERGLVARDQVRRLGCLLPPPVQRRLATSVEAERGGGGRMRVAVTGAGGRLGRALIAALEEAPFTGPRARSRGRAPTSTWMPRGRPTRDRA